MTPILHAWAEIRHASRAAGVALALAAGAAAAVVEAPSRADEVLNLGFTNSMLIGLNENDARASIKALAATVARERGIPADPEPLLFHGAAQAAAALRAGRVDAVSLTYGESRAIEGEALFDRFLLSVYDGDPREQYLLLTHRKRAAAGLAGLQGGRIAVFRNPRMSLASIWLEVELAKAGLPAAGAHFGRIAENAKLSKVVLEAFFQQVDACLVSRRGFATMVELNPQVGKDLEPLLTSPPVVPTFFGLRVGFSPAMKAKVLREFAEIHKSTAGQQALIIFQAGRVAEFPGSVLAEGKLLLDEFARLRPAAYATWLATLRSGTPASAGRAP